MFNGIPVKFKNEKGEELVKFALLDWMQYIQTHPEEKILVFLDK